MSTVCHQANHINAIECLGGIAFYESWALFRALSVVNQSLPNACNCTACQCSLLRQKFMECSVISPALSLFMKHLVIGQRQKANFSAFHWSLQGSLVFIGQHFVTTRVVHFPKRTKTSLITKSDQCRPNHQLLQICTARTPWSESDQGVRPCISAIAG